MPAPRKLNEAPVPVPSTSDDDPFPARVDTTAGANPTVVDHPDGCAAVAACAAGAVTRPPNDAITLTMAMTTGIVRTWRKTPRTRTPRLPVVTTTLLTSTPVRTGLRPSGRARPPGQLYGSFPTST